MRQLSKEFKDDDKLTVEASSSTIFNPGTGTGLVLNALVKLNDESERDDERVDRDLKESTSWAMTSGVSFDSVESPRQISALAERVKRLARRVDNVPECPANYRGEVIKHLNAIASFIDKEGKLALLLTRHVKEWDLFLHQTGEYMAYFIEEKLQESKRFLNKVKEKTKPKPPSRFVKIEPFYYGLVFLPPGSKLIRRLPISQEHCDQETKDLIYSFADAIRNFRTAIVHSPVFQLSPRTKRILLRLANSIERLVALDAREALRIQFLVRYITCHLCWPCNRRDMYAMIDELLERYAKVLPSARNESIEGRRILMDLTCEMSATRKAHTVALFGEEFASATLPSLNNVCERLKVMELKIK